MRLDARPTANRATGPSPSSPAAPAPQTTSLPFPRRLPQPLPTPTTPEAAPTTTTTIIQDRDDVTLRRSVTALDGSSPQRIGERTPAANYSTAFQRSLSRGSSNWRLQKSIQYQQQQQHQQYRYSRTYLLILCLLALLLQMPGSNYLVQVAADETHTAAPTRNPYNEYSWEINQINPWLSACDLAGPAPADLLGSCGPPTVPKKCPGPCSAMQGMRKNGPGHFDDVIQLLLHINKVSGVSKPRKRRSTASEHNKIVTTANKEKKKINLAAATVTRETTNIEARVNKATRKTKTKRAAPEQCLFYLEESHKREVCREDFGLSGARSYSSTRENRFWFMSGLRLRHCCEHAAVNALAPGKDGPLEAVLGGGTACVQALDKLLLMDKLAARLHCEFEEVLARYDCSQTYSVIHNCTHCKEAYRKWVCSSLVPYFAHGGPQDTETSEESWIGRRIRPCRSLCQSVEQRCPYLLPGDRAPAYPTQYAGEPTFLCRDPNIPETGEQAARALHPNTEDECCAGICSEDEPTFGICANCSSSVPYMGPKRRDPPTAPQCDIAALSGPLQSTSQRSSMCGKSGISAVLAEYFGESTSSPISDSSTELPSITTTTAIATTTSIGSTTTSSTANVTSSPVPLLCLFWLWGVLFSSQCSVRCLLGLIGLANCCLRTLHATRDRLLLLIFLTFSPNLDRRLQARRPGRPNQFRRRDPRGNRCFGSLSLVASYKSAIVTVSCTTIAAIIVVAEYNLLRGRYCHCYYCCCYYCYRRWLWPSRWKNNSRLLFSNRFIRRYDNRGRCYCYYWRRCHCWCYWRWLWPCRWKNFKGKHLHRRHSLALLACRGQQRPLWPRKKRRRKVRFGASCCRELDLARSTFWCREPA